jgi:cytochrome c oxidase subunit II
MFSVSADLMAILAALVSVPPPFAPHIFSPVSTPADEIYRLAIFVIAIALGIFVVVASLLAYAVIKFGRSSNDDGREPAQVYGSTQVELSWTVIPLLIVVVLFLTTARVIHGIQDAAEPPGAINVTVVGHQFWWEFRYPQYGVVTANELWVPVSGFDATDADLSHASVGGRGS